LLHPAQVSDGQRADRLAKRTVVRAGGAFDEKDNDEEQWSDHATGKQHSTYKRLSFNFLC
jgi:hypothetical protein